MWRAPAGVDRAATPDAQAAEAGCTRRILVADDNPDAADSLAMTLRLTGHEVEIAHDGRQALAIAGIYHPEIALIDIGMPELNGYELARQIRSESSGSSRIACCSRSPTSHEPGAAGPP